ncbi:MAG: hypothetical protein ACRDOO_10625 [Actinomadura sp.]
MKVTFTKVPGRRYLVAVNRGVGPRLAPRFGPGYDPHLPHDLVHFVVEVEAGIQDGVFGQLASGDCGIFWPADPAERRRAKRRKRRLSEGESADLARSERLVAQCHSLWRIRAGQAGEAPAAAPPYGSEGTLVERICARLDDAARQWHALQIGAGMTVSWPQPKRRHRPGDAERRSGKPPVRHHPAHRQRYRQGA